MAAYSMWTVQKLKRELYSRGASTLDRKQNLINRWIIKSFTIIIQIIHLASLKRFWKELNPRRFMSMELYTFLIHKFCLRRLKAYDRNRPYHFTSVGTCTHWMAACWVSETLGDYAQGNSSEDVSRADWGILYLQIGR